MIHELRLMCSDPSGRDRVMTIRHYSESDAGERDRAIEELTRSALRWIEAGYPVTVIEDDGREAVNIVPFS